MNVTQKIIPAISNMKDFERFLASELTYCIFMNFHITLLEDMVKTAHGRKKKVLIHLDLMRGLSADEYGCEYVCQKLKVEGVISTKGRVIEVAKKNHKISILRIFLIDSQSLEKGITLCNAVSPDYVEVLPGIACSIYPYIRSRINVGIMGGGLIKSAKDIDDCFEAGVCAITISNVKEAIAYLGRL